ncbi:MAG TPA: hypothetical protein PLD10_06680 [Rhodopila sp.]|nr:hypothetical protein [Rhodopila sp.]
MAVETRDRAAIAARVPYLPLAAIGAVFVCLVIAIYDALLLGNFHLALIAPELLDRAFGSMLVHMLHGDFGVDRDAIGFESFTRDGRTYAYFGIFPAVLRLPAMLFVDVTKGGLARLSCLTAMVTFVVLQIRTLWLVHRAVPPDCRSTACLVIMAAATCLSGPQIYLLASATIYHEPIFWAAAMGAGYNLILLRAVMVGRPLAAVSPTVGNFTTGTLTTGDLTAMAALAGLALNTRASVGAALCLSTGLLVLWANWGGRAGHLASLRTAAARMLDRRFLAPVCVLAAFVLVAGIVNDERWGSPLRFADFRYYDFAHRQPWRLVMISTYGEINPIRIPVGLLYYATGLPYMLKSMAGFSEYFRSHFDGLEAPPLSGLVANPLTVILGAVGIWRLVRRPADFPAGGPALLRLALLGHAAAIILVCAAMYLAMRYRMDFAPFMTLAAFAGYPAMMQAARGPNRRRVLVAAVMLCATGVAASHYLLLVHKVWSTAVPMETRLTLLPYAPFARGALTP